MWSIANEPDSFSKGAYEYFKPLYDEARELYPQKRHVRLVSVQRPGCTPKDDISFELSDVICINRYYGWYAGGPDIKGTMPAFRKELDAWKEAGKPVIVTEFVADTVIGLHDTVTTMYTEEYQMEYYEENCKVLDEYPFVIGEHPWNYADFATSQSLVRIQGNKKGIFTRDRRPKLAAHWLRRRWHSIPDFEYKK
jgi:beta-glucuronidase